MNISTRTISVAIIIVGLLGSVATPAQTRPSIAGLQSQISTQQAAIAALQANNVPGLASYLSIDTSTPARPVARFHDVNVQIVDGIGAGIDAVNGLGNLIVGYDEVRTSGAPVCSWGGFTSEPTCLAAGGTWSISHKSGSHNVVIGAEHNYSRGGSLVAGYRNTISGDFATVSGGRNNTASGDQASVSGGSSNTASTLSASVSGGNSNMASGESASVSGGSSNTASATGASVSGGQDNSASATGASVSGGNSNLATELSASVSGGLRNTASGVASSVSGGEVNRAMGYGSSVSGGANRTVISTDDDGWRAGGLFQDN